MSQKPMFICITGIDGVGKTTHVNLILEYLREKGIKCQYKWLRFHYLFSLPLLAFCRVAGYTRMSTLGNFQKCSYHEFYNSRFVSAFYPWILLFDTLLFTTIKVYIPMFFGKSIICDRFVYDTLVDIAVATKDHEIYKKPIGKLFIKLIPKNSHFVMLDLDKSIIFLRRPELKEDLTFEERYALYESLSFHFNIHVEKNYDDVSQVNCSLINMLFRC
jgi:thymidylate kinase